MQHGFLESGNLILTLIILSLLEIYFGSFPWLTLSTTINSQNCTVLVEKQLVLPSGRMETYVLKAPVKVPVEVYLGSHVELYFPPWHWVSGFLWIPLPKNPVQKFTLSNCQTGSRVTQTTITLFELTWIHLESLNIYMEQCFWAECYLKSLRD